MKKGLVAIVFLTLALLLQQRAIAQTGLTVKGLNLKRFSKEAGAGVVRAARLASR